MIDIDKIRSVDIPAAVEKYERGRITRLEVDLLIEAALVDIDYELRLDALSFADWKEWRNLFVIGRGSLPHSEQPLVRPSLVFTCSTNKEQLRFQLRSRGPLPWYAR